MGLWWNSELNRERSLVRTGRARAPSIEVGRRHQAFHVSVFANEEHLGVVRFCRTLGKRATCGEAEKREEKYSKPKENHN